MPSVKKGELCPLCLYVFKAVDDLLEENATKVVVFYSAVDLHFNSIQKNISPEI